jgi:hypothetical protein
MSLPDHALDGYPCLDEYCAEHDVWFDTNDGCPLCALDTADMYADELIELRKMGSMK